MATITGSEVLAQALRSQGVDTMFYLMGGPMLETEAACIKLGIRAIDTRHEQAAAMVAHAWTRVTRQSRRLHGLARVPAPSTWLTGVANALTDAPPLIAIGGSSPRVFARHGGLPGDRPGRAVQAHHQVGRAHLRRHAAFPSVVDDGVPPGDQRAGPARSTSTCPATSWARRSTRSSSTTPGPGAPTPRPLGDPAAVKRGHRAAREGRAPGGHRRAAACGGRTARPRSRPSSRPPASRSTRRRSRAASCAEDHELAFLNARSKAFGEADVVLAVGTRFN